MALGRQRRLAGFAAGEIGHGQIEEGDQAPQQVLQRHVFAEGHQLLLQVGALGVARGGQAVVIAQLAFGVALAHRHTGDQRRIAVPGEAVHHRQVAGGVFLEDGHGRLGPDDQVGRTAGEAHVPIEQQLHFELLGVPLQALGDVALHRGNAQGLALGFCPGVAVECQACRPGRGQQHQGAAEREFAGIQPWQLDQQRRAQRDGEGQQPDAAHRRQARQWAFQLAVARIQPGKTGQHPAAQRIQCQPERGECQRVGQGRLLAPQPAAPEPAEQGEEQCQPRDETQGEGARQRRRRCTEVMDADVDPADAGTEQAEAVAPAALRGVFRPQCAQPRIEQGDGEKRQRPDIERRQRQGGQCAASHGKQIARPAGTSHPAHRRSVL